MKHKQKHILFTTIVVAIIFIFNTTFSLMAESNSYLDSIYQAVEGYSEETYSEQEITSAN